MKRFVAQTSEDAAPRSSQVQIRAPRGGQGSALCVSDDALVIEQVEACAAAARVEVVVVSGVEALRSAWRDAAVVLVGADRAALVAGARLPERARVHLVGPDAGQLVGWSVPLRASVIVLPDQSSTLSAVLSAGDVDAAERAQVVRLVGASGGLGVSTLAAALGLAAARRGSKVAVVELSPHSGGLDLLVGAEADAGWRWPELVAASGHVGDLSGRLLRAHDVDLVSNGREFARPGQAAIDAVVGSLLRSHDLVVLDQGQMGQAAVGLPGRVQNWLVVGAEVRSVMGARALLAGGDLDDPSVVVRAGKGRGLPPDQVAEAVGLPLLGRVRDDPRVVAGSEAGDPPGRSRRSLLARDVQALMSALSPLPSRADEQVTPSRAAPTLTGLPRLPERAAVPATTPRRLAG